MDIFSKEYRTQHINLLEFVNFLSQLTHSLRKKRENINNGWILDFLNGLDVVESWYRQRTMPYCEAVTDSIFWESRKFYHKAMVKFVVGELTGLEFAGEFWDKLMLDKEKSTILLKDLKKQADIELNPKSFQFSKIILAFEIPLEVYQNEMDELETDDQASLNDLSFTEDSLKQTVERELVKVNSYLID